MSELITISDPSDLDSLESWKMTPPMAHVPVHLNASGPPIDKIRRWEKQLTRLHSSCGCEQGAGGLLVGVFSYLIYLLVRPGGWGHPGSRDWWIGCGVVVVTSCAGKVLGILGSRRRLRRVIREIQTEWKPQRPQPRDFGTVTAFQPTSSRRCCGGT
jgi:hypothetical protein